MADMYQQSKQKIKIPPTKQQDECVKAYDCPSVKIQGYHSYNIMTYTGECAFAGTNAKIFVTLCGSIRESEEFYLQKSLEHDNPFERKNRDSFKFRSQNLGPLYKLKIRHENRGIWAGWYLEKIVVVHEETNMTYEFGCGNWLFKDSSSSLEYELEAN